MKTRSKRSNKSSIFRWMDGKSILRGCVKDKMSKDTYIDPNNSPEAAINWCDPSVLPK